MADDHRNFDSEEISEFLEQQKHIKIERNEEKIMALKSFMEEKLPTIYRVPAVFHKMNEHAYTPSVVAIGPLHRGKKHLQAMEEKKVSYMHFLFDRTENFEKTQGDCVAAMLEMESHAKSCYADDVRLNNSENGDPKDQEFRFAEMMLIDGCFMIELFYRCYLEVFDPILKNTFKRPAILQDLLLLENQIPFEVLAKLYHLTVERIPAKNCDCRPSLTECVLSSYWDVTSLEERKLIKIKMGDYEDSAHLLHLIHSCHLRAAQPLQQVSHNLPEEQHLSTEDLGVPPEHEPSSSVVLGNIKCSATESEHEHSSLVVLSNFKYSATELDLGGIKFVQGNNNDRFNVKFMTRDNYVFFWRRGHFIIPPFLVNDFTELFWRNFIAFEQSCHFIAESNFTSHALLMDRLINNTEDVQLLERTGIIVNSMGCREQVAHLFNNLCKNIVLKHLNSTDECQKVIDFNKRLWPKFLLILRRDYFGNPWTFISVLAAIGLYVLTLLQTIYTMSS